MQAVQQAASLSGVVAVSMGWSTSEFFGETQDDSNFKAPVTNTGSPGTPTSPPIPNPNVTFVAATGTVGSPQGTGYPAFSPNVLAVGGTTLTPDSSTSRGYDETPWSGFFYGTAYGTSGQEKLPAYQQFAAGQLGIGNARINANVSFAADPGTIANPTGVAVYDVLNGGNGPNATPWFNVGGTSVGTPPGRGSSQLRTNSATHRWTARQTLPILYYDVYGSYPSSTSYFNDFYNVTSAVPAAGYNEQAGLGTPIANNLIGDLAGNSHAFVAVTSITTDGAPTRPPPQAAMSTMT